MADGFGGAGYIDPATGEWVSTPGATLNTTGPDIPQPRPINTPNSSTGQPAFADPSAPDFQFATPQGGQLTTTPNSRTGAPAPGIRTLPATRPRAPMPLAPGANPATMPGMPLGGALGTGVGALLGAPTTDQGVYDNANRTGSAVDNFGPVKWAIEHGWLSPSPKWGPAAAAAPAAYSPSPLTQPGSGPGRGPSGPVPPGGPPPINLPPFNVPPPGPFVRGPVPAYVPQHGNARAPSIQPSGGGASGPQAAAPPAPSMVDLGHYRATVGVGRGTPTWVPGGMDSPAPQIYRGPQTAYGAPMSGAGPRGAQNYYIPGSAPMGPGDWTGTGPPAGALAAPNAGGNARGGGAPNMDNAMLGMQLQNAGGRSSAPRAQAPVSGFQPKKFFANPANWQYPNMPF